MSHTMEQIQDKLDRIVEYGGSGACGCLGPQDDAPVCPCQMKYMINYRGVWFKLEQYIEPK